MQKLRKVCEKMTEHLKMKHRMKEDIKTYSDMVNSSLLSVEEKKLLNLIYIEKQDYLFIGDSLGISESTVKKRHKDLLKKISKILQAGL